ncbi:MAG: spondin domain-containing protein [Bacteroidetes bacterium]|nr:spondin domain-containing protein [Bacteroidota bacterium]
MKKIIYLAGLAIAISGCKKDDCPAPVTPTADNSRTFKVLVENISTTTTLQTGAMPDRSVPLSHGVYAVYASGSLFTLGQAADEGIQRIAEDGMTTVKTDVLNNMSGIFDHGEFVAPGGPDNGSALFMGESSMFMISAKPGDKLQIASMFVQSNDWFYGFGEGGLALFNGTTAITGDVSSKLVLYDAGSELDEAPGLGTTQKPDQQPMDMNIGPNDGTTIITDAMVRHSATFTIPATNMVIRVTVTPQ